MQDGKLRVEEILRAIDADLRSQLAAKDTELVHLDGQIRTLLRDLTEAMGMLREVAESLEGEPGRSTHDYRDSISAPDSDDMFTLAYQWQDKRHRHVFDLCNRIDRAAIKVRAFLAKGESLPEGK